MKLSGEALYPNYLGKASSSTLDVLASAHCHKHSMDDNPEASRIRVSEKSVRRSCRALPHKIKVSSCFFLKVEVVDGLLNCHQYNQCTDGSLQTLKKCLIQKAMCTILEHTTKWNLNIQLSTREQTIYQV